MKKGHIFFICWVTWSWKGTLINWIVNEKIKNLEFVLSCKTREPRVWEILWKDYIKLTTEEFKKSIENGDFLEYNFVHNQDYYWTRKIDVLENWIDKWKIILKEVDMLIVPELIEKLKDNRENFSIIFLDLPLDLIKERMILRWEKVDSVNYQNRIDSAKKEIKNAKFADLLVDARQKKEDVLEQVKNYIFSKI